MKVILRRFLKGNSVRYFNINSIECSNIWKELKLPKVAYLEELKRPLLKPKNFLAFTSIVHTFSYSYNSITKIVEKVIIYEIVIIFLPKLKRMYLIKPDMRFRWLRFLNLAKLHEKIYHFDFYYLKQRRYLIKSLKKLKNPTKKELDEWIIHFNKKLVKEQEKSHMKAPKAEFICSNDYLSKILLY